MSRIGRQAAREKNPAFDLFPPFTFCFFTRLPESTSTSRRFLTVRPSGRVPSASIRSGQRAHLGLLVQHFVFGNLVFAWVRRAVATRSTLARSLRVAYPFRLGGSTLG